MTVQGTMVPRWMSLTVDGSWKPIGASSTQRRASRYTVRDLLTNDPYDGGDALDSCCGVVRSSSANPPRVGAL